MAEPMITERSKKIPKKRKRESLYVSPDDKKTHIETLKRELKSLNKFYKETFNNKVGLALNINDDITGNSAIAVLLEEREVSLSKVVDEIYNKIKSKESGVSLGSVKNMVILIGQRVSYGVSNVDADVFEDQSDDALWCWETRDLKLMPKSVRAPMKNRRICRKKIHERIIAVSEMIAALQKLEDDQSYEHDIRKASEMLGKALSESDIRMLQQRLEQKIDVNKSETEAKKDQKELMKQLEKSKREAEKEKKKLDREIEKEKKQSEKELRRLQDEAEKEERRREKEESELRKLIRRQEEEAEKEQRYKEKEEAEKKKQLSMQKQASIMERFLKKSKTSSPCQNDQSSAKTTKSDLSLNKMHRMPEPVTQSLDYALSQNEIISAEDIRKSHLSSWRILGRETRRNEKRQHWGIRKLPKTEVIKEIKLGASKGLSHDEMCLEKPNDGWTETKAGVVIIDADADNTVSSSRKHYPYKQLLQFDKSHRPAFYGIWPKKSQIVGPRCPLKMDPDLDYDVDSDEEWEEEEPGESLSDCDKDDKEECLEEGNAKVDEEDESGDGFFVPDGYLSESEGVEVERKENDAALVDANNISSSKQEFESEELCLMLRQQRQLHSWTEQALRKNKPLIIVNTRHEKVSLFATEELTGIAKLERTCLQALIMRPFLGFPSIKISVCNNLSKCEDTSMSDQKNHATPVAATKSLTESDLPQIVSIIQTCSPSISKVVTGLQETFPSVPKYLLKNKVREISDFVDSRWQVKKEILDKLGLSISPDKGRSRENNIASFFSKRCLPPGYGKTIDFIETSAPSPQKLSTTVEMCPGGSNIQQQPMDSTQSHHS